MGSLVAVAAASTPQRLPSSRVLGHARIDTTQVYAQVRPARLKQAVGFYEGKALEALTK